MTRDISQCKGPQFKFNQSPVPSRKEEDVPNTRYVFSKFSSTLNIP